MSWLGYAGLALIAVAFVVVLLGVAAVLRPALRLRRASDETSRLAEMYRQSINLAMAERDELMAEQAVLARPFGTLRRWGTHPLALALLESYRLRRRRARQAAAL